MIQSGPLATWASGPLVVMNRDVSQSELDEACPPTPWDLRRRLRPWDGAFGYHPRPTLFPKPPGSPIEELLAQALHAFFPPQVEIYAERQLGNYRVDFLLHDERTHTKVVIEADSWQWHGNRKSFENDRVRTRELQRRGLTVMSFSGRQINTNAHLCAAEAAEFFLGRWATFHPMATLKHAMWCAEENKKLGLSAGASTIEASVWKSLWFDWTAPYGREAWERDLQLVQTAEVITVDEALSRARARV